MSLNYRNLAKANIACLLPLFLFCFSLSKSFAQDGTFSGTEITSFAADDFNQIFEQFNIYELNSTAFDDFVKSDNYDSKVRLNFANTFDWDMTLMENDIRGERYVLKTATEKGIEELPKGPVITFSGYLNNDPLSEVRLTIQDNFIYGYVKQGKLTNFIEPANRFSKNAAANQYIIYNTLDVKEDSGKKCGVTDIEDSEGLVAPPQNSQGRSLACKRLELAIASDYSYMVARGGKVGDAAAAALAVMNTVQGDYTSGAFADNIEFEIVEQFVSTCEICDPSTWTNTTNANTLLSNFRTWGNAGGFSNGTDYDLAQFWTARDICGTSCSTVGLAYRSPNVVCGFSRYHILEDFSTNANSLRVLTSHEIGHNFNLSHDSGSGFIMSPSVNNTTTWSPTSISTFNTHTPNLACLDACGAVACDLISNLDIQMTNVASPQINLSWTGTAAGNYRIRVKEENTNVDIFTQNTTSTNLNITPSLESCKKYEVIVEANCSGTYSNPTVGLIVPLEITSPNGGETWTAGNNETLRWYFGNSGADCNIVDILLSIDGGQNFPFTLAKDITNDGNESLSIPLNIANSTNARIKVVCANSCTTVADISDSDFTLSSSCTGRSSLFSPTNSVTAESGNAALNLSLAPVYGTSINSKALTTTNASPMMPLTLNSSGCANNFGQSNPYAAIEFYPTVSGIYNFTQSSVSISSSVLNLYINSFDENNSCDNWLACSTTSSVNGGQPISNINLVAGTKYVIVLSAAQFGSGNTGSATINFSTTVSEDGLPNPGASYGYTYIAVNNSSGNISAISASADFTGLSEGAFTVYGVTLLNSDISNFNSYLNTNISDIYSGNVCLTLSSSSLSLTVTAAPCTNPTLALGTITDPTTCSGTNGSIQLTGLTASTAYTLNYKKDNVDATAVNFNSDGSGNYILANLGAGAYTAINVTISTCTSSNLTTSLSDPTGSTAAMISGNASICDGQSTDITVQITGGLSPYTLVYSGGTITGYESNDAITVSPTSNTDYTITSVTDANGCVGTGNTGTASVMVQALPNVDVIGNQVVDNGDMTAAVNFSGTGTSYAWTNSNPNIGLGSLGTGNISAFMTMNPGVATIEVTPSINGCAGPSKSFTITVNSTAATCTNGLYTVDTSVDNATYYCDTVSSAETIPANITVTYEGCKEVTLTPGFHAVASSTFTASISSCAPLTDTENTVNQSRANTQSTVSTSKTEIVIHPNPARDFVTVNYQLEESSTVSIGLFDITGKQLNVVIPRQTLGKGNYQQQISLTNYKAGMYFMVLQTEKEQFSKKMIIVR